MEYVSSYTGVQIDDSVNKRHSHANKDYLDTLDGTLTEVICITTDALTVAEVSGTILNNYGQAAADVAMTLPEAIEGLNFLTVIGTTQAGSTWKLTADANDKIYLDGVAGTDGQSVIVTPAIGNNIRFYTFKVSEDEWDWIAETGSGTWTSGA